MSEISVKFVDFWPSFDESDNVFTRALSARYQVRVLAADSCERPHLLFYSAFGHSHYQYDDCIKIYYTGENDVPNFNECDYALSFHHIDFGGRHLRYPLYLMYELNDALNPPALTDVEALNRGFASLLMRNSTLCDPKRLAVIDAVEAYKPITYGGSFRNNIGGNVADDAKIQFIKDYKFNLALENSALPGYVTEKLVEALAAPTVPIYWGAPDVAQDFNPEAYINVSDYASLDSMIDDLRAIDHDDKRYLSILRAPRLKADIGLRFDEQLSDFLCKIAVSEHLCRSRQAMERTIYRNGQIRSRLLGKQKLVDGFGKLLRIGR